MARKNFTNAIKAYIEESTVVSGVNLYSLSTRVMYMSLFGDANVTRNNLDDDSIKELEVIEDIAAAYIVVKDIHPVEAVALAYQRLVRADVAISDITTIITMAQKAAYVDALQNSSDNFIDTLAYRQHLSIIDSVHACLKIND